MADLTPFGAAAAISIVLQWLKGTKYFPWINEETEKANRVFTILASGLVSLGIHWQWNAAAHSLLLEGLYWQTIGMGLWHWFNQWAMTHGWYKITSGDLATRLKPVIKQVLAELLTSELSNAKYPLPTSVPSAIGGVNPPQASLPQPGK